MKIARVSATFPELKGSDCYADGKGKGSTPRAAISRAFEDLFSQPNMKGKRFSSIRADITIMQEASQPDGTSS